MRQRLDRFIHHNVTEAIVGILIVLSVALMVVERFTTEAAGIRVFCEDLGNAITALFVVELSIRWYVARSSRWFWREYWLDVLATLPLARPLRMLRVLRLLRLIRLGIRLSRRTRRLTLLFEEGISQNLVIIASLVMVFLFGAIGISLVEQQNPNFGSFGQAIWWSLVTMMAGEPIGGEPTTWAGRLVTLAVMLGGFTIFAMFTGVISAVMVARLRTGMEAKEMELDDLQDHYVICGWNRAAPRIIAELQADPLTRNQPIVIVAELEHDPVLPREGINDGLIFFVREDYTSADVLHRVGLERARRAILLADKSRHRSDQDRDARTVLAALTIEKLNPGIHTCVELLNRANGKVLELVGVEEILVGDEYMGNVIAHATRTAGLVRALDELLRANVGNQFYRIALPPGLANQRLDEALIRLKHERNLLILGVEQAGKRGDDGGAEEKPQLLLNPPPDLILRQPDHLLVIGTGV
ncbi:MAG: ion transporter [Verrucomicrobiales bacterium]|nr:ion transporter [Verrucomicrobiales bacterium]